MSESKEIEKIYLIPKLIKEKSDLKSNESDERRTIRPPTLLSKIGRPCQHTIPKAGPPPRDSTMSRDSVDNANSPFTDQGAVLTSDTENFIIGQRIYVGGTRPGQIAYIGETHFAPGEWAGIVLEESNGKNDGCVAGKRYFQCEAKKGIFSRLTRLTLEPIRDLASSSRTSPTRSRTVSPTASVRSSFLKSPGGKQAMADGDRVIVSSGMGSRKGILRFHGETQFASGNWCGIELDEQSGKNDGSVDGVRYFECPAKHGIFVPIAKVSLSPSSVKPRMSRTGSRDSLTSIGTLNSIATTNTSRLRMSAQKKTSPLKQVTPTKSSFSLQDVIREKQNHIEQLMIERELNLEESQNQSLQFQKNINELKGRIADLEKRLGKEKKKTEDLQVSVDEATFCGDELNAQSQYYVEKIAELESKLLQISAGNGDTSSISETLSDIVSAKVKESAELYKSQIATLIGQEKSLQDNIKYLSSQNKILQKDLLSKDERLEKLSNNVEELERLRQEIVMVKGVHQNEVTQNSNVLSEQLSNRDKEIKKLSNELSDATSKLFSLENHKSKLETQYKTVQKEFLNRDVRIEESSVEINQLKTKLVKEMENSKKLSNEIKQIEMKRTEQENNQMSTLEKKEIEIHELKEELQQLTTDRTACDNRMKQLEIELNTNKKLQLALEDSVKGSADEKANKITELETHIQKLNNHISEVNTQNEKLSTKIKTQIEERTILQSDYQIIQKNCNTQKKLIDEKNAEFQTVTNQLESIKLSSKTLQETHSEYQTQKQLELAALYSTNTELAEKLQQHEADSLSTIESLNLEIAQISNLNKSFEESGINQIAEINQLKEKLSKQEQEAANSLKDLLSKIKTFENANQNYDETSQQKDSEIAKLRASLSTEQKKSAKTLQELKIKVEELDALQTISQENLNIKSTEIESLYGKLSEQEEESQVKLQDLNLKLQEFENLRISIEKDSQSKHSELENIKEQLEKQKEISASSDLSQKSKIDDLINANKSLEESEKLKNSELEKLKAIVVEKENSVQEKITQLTEHVGKLESLNKAYDDIKLEHEKLKSKNTEILENLKANDAKSAKQELEFSNICRKHEALTTKCESLTFQNVSLQNDLGTLRSTSTDSNAEIIKLTEDVANKQKLYQEILDKSTAERIELENQLQGINQRLASTQVELDSLKTELKSSSDQKYSDLENFEKLRSELISKNENEVHEMKTKFDVEKQKIKEDFEDKLQLLDQSKAELNVTIAKLQDQIHLLEEQLLHSENTSKSKEADLLAQLQNYFTEKESLQSTIQNIQSEGSSTLTLVEQEKFSLLSQIETLTEELQKKNVEIENFKLVVEKSRSDYETLHTKFNERENAFQALENDLEAFKLQFNTETSKTKDIKEKYDDSKMKLIASEKTNSELERKIAETINTLEAVEKSKSELELKSSENKQVCDDLKTKLDSANKANTELTLKITEIETKFWNLSENLENVQKQKSNDDTITANYKDQLHEIESKLNIAEKTNSELLCSIAELMQTLTALDKQKCEISNNFELFELESDKKVAELKDTKLQLENDCLSLKKDIFERDNNIVSLQTNVNTLSNELETLKSNVGVLTSSSVENSKQVADLNAKNVELLKSLFDKDATIQQLNEKLQTLDSDINKKIHELTMMQEESLKIMSALPTEEELQIQAEKDDIIKEHNSKCKASIDEFVAKLTKQTTNLNAVQAKFSLLEKEKSDYVDAEHSAVLKYNSLLKKMEVLESQNLNEISALKDRINDLQSITKIKDDKHLINDKDNTEGTGSEAQINFLNSIIADMHKTNETLKAKIAVLESGPTDYTKPLAFEIIGRRKPTPRMFCDICDEFDLHETEDCPLQSSDSPPQSSYLPGQIVKERIIPPSKDYCESCEVFGHKIGECPDDESY